MPVQVAETANKKRGAADGGINYQGSRGGVSMVVCSPLKIDLAQSRGQCGGYLERAGM